MVEALVDAIGRLDDRAWSQLIEATVKVLFDQGLGARRDAAWLRLETTMSGMPWRMFFFCAFRRGRETTAAVLAGKPDSWFLKPLPDGRLSDAIGLKSVVADQVGMAAGAFSAAGAAGTVQIDADDIALAILPVSVAVRPKHILRGALT